MIPFLQAEATAQPEVLDFYDALRLSSFSGDIEFSAATTTVFSTDNSIYQVQPQGVIFPRGIEDLQSITQLLFQPQFRHLKMAMRGGGTGTNGQSLTDGLVVDTSRYMNRILSIDPEKRTARVQSGVVKDQLNKALKPHGLFFAPELSTSNRATIGGMINTDACGQGSCLYGKTSNHVLALRAVLMDGSELNTRPVSAYEMQVLQQDDNRSGSIYRLVDEIERDNRDLIDKTFPKLNRFLTGYDLAHLREADGGLNLNALLCGAEGTLALIAEAELNLLPIPRFAALINIRYDDFNTALRDARFLTGLQVASVETIDAKVLSLARGDIIWNGIAAYFPSEEGKRTDGINIVEVLADNAAELREKISFVCGSLEKSPLGGRHGFTTTEQHADIEAIWTMRKRAVGLLGNVEGPRRPVAFVEDTAVPPENLADYIVEFRALLDSEGLDYGMFGHVDAGVLHVRPALDLSDPAQEPMVRRISDAVVALTLKYGGVLWGEHGKGVRSEYVPAFFGALYPQLQRIKAAFDPYNQLNAGKIATPDAEALTKIDELELRGQKDRIIAADIRNSYDNAPYCNGNGACFDFNTDSAMCPSFKGSGDRRYSPKGRASLIREWLRLLAENGVDPRQSAKNLREKAPWNGLFARVRNSLGTKNSDDFSHQVREAMDTCLACKACAGQCPVKVNVPAFRSKFLELYYSRYLRPLKDPLIASIEHMMPLVARTGKLYNAMMKSGVGRWGMKQVGLTALPSLSDVSLSKELQRRNIMMADPAQLQNLTEAQKVKAVILVQDSFTTFFDTQLLLDVIDLLRILGFTPYLAALKPNGKAQHVHGYMKSFTQTARTTSQYLNSLAKSNVPLIGLDPSMTLTYRSEYKSALPNEAVPDVLLPQEWLAQQLGQIAPFHTQPSALNYMLLPHCTEKTNASPSIAAWHAIFKHFGVSMIIGESGCCGMAGTFGHELRNRDLSESIYDLSWRQKMQTHGREQIVMATGFSCRSQVEIMEKTHIHHPLQVLKQLLTAA
ncbi:FAD-binding and (Fe-S)-binding domain-containing protein [Pseudochrobactrum sp. MP213Fo]|uniref:D-2-hydroxyglutarate dehydrogenase YdiJ n=1 Tax=Pseudochrobactrum sp. MP213Fo TaxID=3022250 RepID=UPI003BA128B7